MLIEPSLRGKYQPREILVWKPPLDPPFSFGHPRGPIVECITVLKLRSWQSESLIRYVMWILMCFGLSGVALFWLDKALEAGWNLDGQTGVLCVNLVFLQLGVVWATWWLIRDHGMSWQQAFGLSVSNPARICRFALQAALLGFLVASFLGGMIQMSLEALGQEAAPQEIVHLFQESTRPENRIIIALTAVLLAPLVEELLFRGVVFTALLQYLPRFWAFALSSLFFGLVHFNAVSLLPLSILAALFAWSYEKTGNLWVPILAHSLFNLINLGLMLWLPLWMETPSP